jgi:hypothetical protein
VTCSGPNVGMSGAPRPGLASGLFYLCVGQGFGKQSPQIIFLHPLQIFMPVPDSDVLLPQALHLTSSINAILSPFLNSAQVKFSHYQRLTRIIHERH